MRNLRGYKNDRQNDRRDALKNLGIGDEKMERYSSMSEDELISELMHAVRRQKANNTFDARQLETLVAMAAPRLNAEQRDKLNDLVFLIKNT